MTTKSLTGEPMPAEQQVVEAVERVSHEIELSGPHAEVMAVRTRDVAALLSAYDNLLKEVEDLTKALTGLTCGGSEFFVRKGERFVANISACVDHVRRCQRDAHERALSYGAKAREALAAKEAAEAEVDRLRTLAENYGAEIAHLEQGIALYKIGDIETARVEAEARAEAAEAEAKRWKDGWESAQADWRKIQAVYKEFCASFGCESLAEVADRLQAAEATVAEMREIAERLEGRANECRHLTGLYDGDLDRARASGKAAAYEHAAQLLHEVLSLKENGNG